MKILASLGLVLTGLLTGLWHAWVLTCLWGWFMVPWAHFPQLSIGYAYGLWLIIGLITQGTIKQNEPKIEDTEAFMAKTFVALVGACLSSALTLGFAYITYLIIR